MHVAPLSYVPTASDNRRGILSMLAASLSFTTGDALVRLTSAGLPVSQIMFVRGVMSVIIVLSLMYATGVLSEVRALGNKILAGRSLVEAITTTTFIMALPHLPLANVISIVSAAPLIMTAIIVLLGLQTVGWRRWAAILTGFVGVLFVVQPSASGIGLPALLLITCATFVAVRDLFSQRAPSGISTLAITLGTTLSVTVTGAVLGLFQTWQWPQTKEMIWLACAACCVACGNYFIIRAFRNSDPTIVTPFRYISILISVIMGFAIWGELPNALAAIGALLIIGSGIYTIWRERVRSREALAQFKSSDAGAHDRTG